MSGTPRILLLLLLFAGPLAGQVESDTTDTPLRLNRAAHSSQANPDSAALPDTAAVEDDEDVVTRALGGAIVGAVTGAVLNVQGSDCAPARTAGRSSLLGAFWGALRSALRREDGNELPLPDSRDGGGEQPPYPFDGEGCQTHGSD